MQVTKERKVELFKKHGKSETDSGAAEAQIALFTERISHLTDHLKKNRKDYNTQRSLVALVGKRKRLLNHLKATEIARYRSIIKELKLRK